MNTALLHLMLNTEEAKKAKRRADVSEQKADKASRELWK